MKQASRLQALSAASLAGGTAVAPPGVPGASGPSLLNPAR
jgi:hypothetical protein